MQLISPQAPPDTIPTHFDLGQTNAEILLNTAEDHRNAAVSLTRQANRSVYIYTQDLDKPIYDNSEFTQNLLYMVRHYHHTRIRILLRDSQSAVKKSHSLINLSQKLTSNIEVKTITDDYREIRASFMIVDKVGLLFRAKASLYEGSVNFNSPARALKLIEYFNEVWEKSEPDPDFRKLHI